MPFALMVASANFCCHVPNRFFLPYLHYSRNPNLLPCSSFSSSSSSLSTTRYRSQKQRRRVDNTLPFYLLSSQTGYTGFGKQSPEGLDGDPRQPVFPRADSREGISSSMWRTDLKAAVGQRKNVQGIISSAAVLVRDRHLAPPHVSMPDIRYMDWSELKRKGFFGVVAAARTFGRAV